MARRMQLRLLLAVTIVWMAWAAWALVAGDGGVTLVVATENGEPITEAVVVAGDRQVAVTDSQGIAQFEWTGGMVEVEAPGYLPKRLDVLTEDHPNRVFLQPTMLRGEVMTGEGLPVGAVRLQAEGQEAVSQPDGSFLIRYAEPGQVTAHRPAWHPISFPWDGSPGARTLQLQPRIVKAVHVTGEAAGDSARWQEMLDLVEVTELNGIMLDLKDEWGLVYYDTSVEVAHRVGSVYPTYDLAEVAEALREMDIYLIGRIVAFQDPKAALGAPELAIGDEVTGQPFRKGNQYFLDPTDPDARAYVLALVEEACRLGVDEVQLDYIRFPDGYGPEATFDGPDHRAGRVLAIRSILEQARAVLHPMGCALAADLFGFTTAPEAGDGGIGQDWDVVTEVLDVASPMLYPSHYSSGWYGFDNPVEHPGPMVDRALGDGMRRLDSGVVVRPWLQDFGYTEEQVRAQIEAAEKYGLGWMLWNAVSNVTVGALERE